MRFLYGFVSVVSASEGQSLDVLLLNKNIQVPVHRAHAEAGKFLLESVVQPVCCGVRPRLHKQFQYSLSLFASSVFHSGLTEYDNQNDYYYKGKFRLNLSGV